MLFWLDLGEGYIVCPVTEQESEATSEWWCGEVAHGLETTERDTKDRVVCLSRTARQVFLLCIIM